MGLFDDGDFLQGGVSEEERGWKVFYMWHAVSVVISIHTIIEEWCIFEGFYTRLPQLLQTTST